jgi:4-diphosphocytidyl-2-C-methyl-D-erythritol kinase
MSSAVPTAPSAARTWAPALPADDLIVRAARALRQATGCGAGRPHRCTQAHPAQAGMGGGSSDAATTLLALNRLWGLEPEPGATGAHRPGAGRGRAFLHARRARLGGGHRRAHPPLHLPPARFLVVKPPQGLETARIFQAPELKRDSKSATISGFAADPYGFGHNDLQPVAERLCPQVAQGLALLSRRGLLGRMTGSGNAVFAPVAEAARPATWPMCRFPRAGRRAGAAIWRLIRLAAGRQRRLKGVVLVVSGRFPV